MLYVGLTENHRESATMFANVVGAQAISKFAGSNSRKGLVANSIPGQCQKQFASAVFCFPFF